MSDAQADSTVDPPATEGEQPVLLPDLKLPAPVVAEAPATEPAAEDVEATDEQQAQRERDAKGKFIKPVQPRIDELTREREDAKREAAYWRQRAEMVQQQHEAAQAAPEAPQEPTLEQFPDYPTYVRALAQFEARQAAADVMREFQSDEREQTAAQQRQTAWEQRSEAARGVLPDFDAVVTNSRVQVAKHVGELLLESDVGPQLSYQMATDPTIADRLNRLSPMQAAKEIARMEDRLAGTSPPPSNPAVPVRRTSAAAPPATPMNSGRNSPIDLEKASMEEYIVHRAKWAGRR